MTAGAAIRSPQAVMESTQAQPFRGHSWPPKTKAGRRTIALDAGTVRALRDRRRVWAAEKVKAGQVYRDEDLVFCRADGSHLDPTCEHGLWASGRQVRATQDSFPRPAPHARDA